jgi:hypothetical protein
VAVPVTEIAADAAVTVKVVGDGIANVSPQFVGV